MNTEHKIERVESAEDFTMLVVGDGMPHTIRPWETWNGDPYSMICTYAPGIHLASGKPILYEILEVALRERCGHLECASRWVLHLN